jgi:protein polybromo-1
VHYVLSYIEGLSSGSQSVGGWEKSLYAKAPENPTMSSVPAPEKLPVHWLGNGPGHHDNSVNALWALRDLMMKDAMTISRVLDFSQV